MKTDPQKWHTGCKLHFRRTEIDQCARNRTGVTWIYDADVNRKNALRAQGVARERVSGDVVRQAQRFTRDDTDHAARLKTKTAIRLQCSILLPTRNYLADREIICRCAEHLDNCSMNQSLTTNLFAA